MSNPPTATNSRPFKRFYCDDRTVFRLPPTPFKVWMYRYSREGQDRKSWPSQATICQDLDISEASLKRAQRYLRDNGWLVKVGQRDCKSGEFDVPEYMVDKGVIPITEGSKSTHGPRGQKAPTVAGSKSTHGAGSKSTPEVDSFEVDSKREVEPKTPSSPSDKLKGVGQEMLVWLSGLGLNLVRKQQNAIREVCLKYPAPILKAAAEKILAPLTIGNSFDKCEDKVADNLELSCEAILAEKERHRRIAELVRSTMQHEQETAQVELQRAVALAAEENSLIEECLP